MRLAQAIDAHVHLWDPRRLGYPWLRDVPQLNRSFLPADFRQACEGTTVEKIVFVECDCQPSQNLEEVRWIRELAADESRIGGIVARVALENGPAARGQLAELSREPLVKGIRRLLQGEADPEFCLRPDFVAGVESLADFGFSFDLCLVHHQLRSATQLARRCPRVRFMLDHLGKPAIKEQRFDPWRTDLRELAQLPNVWCKVSGLVTEADHRHWQPSHLAPYLEHVWECFGWDRVVYGGDWPVSTLAASYGRWLDTLVQLVSRVSEPQRQKLFADNAKRFYRL